MPDNRVISYCTEDMTRPSHILFRPPAEAESVIIRVADGCPWNQCAFCGMYTGVSYRVHTEREIRAAIVDGCRRWPDARRVFLADGDVMALPFAVLMDILAMLAAALPRLARVNLYANGRSIQMKSDDELRTLSARGLQTLYMGLESGSDAVLTNMRKRETAGEMINAGRRAQACGLRMSVMVLIGLGGAGGSAEHAAATAAALNRMQPRLLSALRVIPVPGTRLHGAARRGLFEEVSEWQAVRELRDLIAALELEGTVFRANHTSNVVPLEGRLPHDKQRLLCDLDALLAADVLDRTGPGPAPLSL